MILYPKTLKIGSLFADLFKRRGGCFWTQCSCSSSKPKSFFLFDTIKFLWWIKLFVTVISRQRTYADTASVLNGSVTVW